MLRLALILFATILLIFGPSPCNSVGITIDEKYSYAQDSLPPSLNWKDSGLVTPPKTQIGNTCVAMSSVALIESNMLKMYSDSLGLTLADRDTIDMSNFDYSEQQVQLCVTGHCGMSNFLAICKHWRDQYGPILEDDWGYGPEGCVDTTPCTETQYNEACRVYDFEPIKNDLDVIKTALLLHGPVRTVKKPHNICGHPSSYVNACYECDFPPNMTPHHAIVIAGFDDSKCNGNGALLIRDGDSSPKPPEDRGYYWFSYNNFDDIYDHYLLRLFGESVWVNDSTGSDTSGDGSQNSPFKTIAKAMQVSHQGDTIKIESGVYSGVGNTGIVLDGKRLIVMAANDSSNVIIDCDSSTYALKYLDISDSINCKLKGITVKNGYSFTYGAGVILYNAHLQIEDCIFEHCQSKYGGSAIHANSGGNSSIHIDKCKFRNNTIVGGTSTWPICGGATFFENQIDLKIDSCHFYNNLTNGSSSNDGGGGGIFIDLDPSNSGTISNCFFDNNQCGDYTAYGAAIYADGDIAIQNCTFVNNDADTGSAIYIASADADLTINRNIFAYNENSAAVYSADSDAEISFNCNLFWDNEDLVGGGHDSTDLDQNTIFLSPHFCWPDSSNYALCPCSPAAPDNSPCDSLIGALDVDCTIYPVLTSPSDGSYVNDNPRLFQWNDLNGADYYYLCFDNNSDFSSPEIIEDSLVSSQWTYIPDNDTIMTSGTWYWRVKGNIDAYWSCWSQEWSFTRDAPASCPVLYVADGVDYRKENPLLTACQHLGYTTNVEDFYHVRNGITANNGNVNIQLREEEDEITYLQDIELIVVDHDVNSDIAVTIDGQIFAYDEIISPVSAVDHNSQDVLDKIIANDGNHVTYLDPGHIILEFNAPQDGRGAIEIAAGDKDPCRQRIAGDEWDYSQNEVTIEFMDNYGNWSAAWNIPNREKAAYELVNYDQNMILEGSKIVAKISWTKTYLTDVIVQYIPSNAYFSVQKAAPDENSLFSEGEIVLNKGDVLDLTFEVPVIEGEAVEREYIVYVKGRYEPLYIVNNTLTPNEFQLHDNYPNPFNPTTTIDYYLPTASDVTVDIYNVIGQRVAVLVNEHQQPGNKTVVWNGQTESGEDVASGVYFYRLKAAGFIQAKKMIMLK